MKETKKYMYEVIYSTRPTNVEKYFVIMEDDGRCPVDVATSLRYEVENWKPEGYEDPYQVRQILCHEIQDLGVVQGRLYCCKTKLMKTEEIYTAEYRMLSLRHLEELDDTDHPIA